MFNQVAEPLNTATANWFGPTVLKLADTRAQVAVPFPAMAVTEQDTFPLFVTLMFAMNELLPSAIVPKAGDVLLQVILIVPVGEKEPVITTVSAASTIEEKEQIASDIKTANSFVCFFMLYLLYFLRIPSQSLLPYFLFYCFYISFYVPPNVILNSPLLFKKVVVFGITTRNPTVKLVEVATPVLITVVVIFIGYSVTQLSIV